MNTRIYLLSLCFLVGGLGPLRVGLDVALAAESTIVAPKYHCPMHPTVVSDKPGDCPICGMRLVLIAPPTSVNISPTNSTVPGLAPVAIAPGARQRMGLTLGKVDMRDMSRHVRASARIAADETRLFRVTTKVEGWVEKLFVSVSGQVVEKGAPLLTIYSPQLVSAQQEYLSALQAVGSVGMAAGNGSPLIRAARQRLEQWDISDDQIATLEKSQKVEKTLTLVAPSSGFVMDKAVLAGQKIMPGDSLMVVVDLSSVWGEADLYESDLPNVQTGMVMTLTLPYWPGKKFEGIVSFLSPSLDMQTRTVTARMEIPNTDFLLKPGMYADATLEASLGDKLAVSEKALMYSGERTYVFRDDGDGKLVPVVVKIGMRADGYCEVVDGLKEGDQVVTSANFLVDSESSMTAALQATVGR